MAGYEWAEESVNTLYDMGVIKGTKLINNMKFKNNEIKNLLEDFVRLQQKNIDNLKKFL